MRVALLAVFTLALPVLAPAQSRVPAPRVTAPLPSIGLPLPRITAPLASIGLPPARDAQVTLPPAQPPRGHGVHSPATLLFFPYYPYFVGGHHRASQGTGRPAYLDASAESPAAATGTLELAVQPRDLAQIYIDGFFAGMPADFNGDLQLEAGTHRVELRAPGYRTLSFEVRIIAGRSITYRGSLEPLSAPPAREPVDAPPPPAVVAPPTPPAKTTVYLIPGCYLGNVPPDAARLSPTCDVSKVVTFEP